MYFAEVTVGQAGFRRTTGFRPVNATSTNMKIHIQNPTAVGAPQLRSPARTRIQRKPRGVRVESGHS